MLNDPVLTSVWTSLPDPAYGELPVNYQQQIQSHFNHVLIDPLSAIYEFNGSEPYVYYFSGHPGAESLNGIGVIVDVNAKNRMGGYAGRSTYLAFFHDGALRYVASYIPSSKTTYDLMPAQP